MDDECLLRTGSDRERALLAAGIAEIPTEESVRAASIALGILPSVEPPAIESSGLGRSARAGWTKLAANVIAPIAIVGGSVVALHGAWSPGRTPPAGGSVARTEAARAPDSATTFAADDRAPSSMIPTSSTTMAAAPTPTTAPDSPKRKVDTFNAQVALIDRARARASAGDAGGTLQAVDEYDHRFPGGLLSEEALLLRIEAVAMRGGRDSATALAKRFLIEYPRSVHADRLRSYLERSSH